jgi:membrane protease YdiL (CAAX protease family)
MATDASTSDVQFHLRTIGSAVSMVAGALLVAVLTTSIGASLIESAGGSLTEPGPRALLDALQFVGFGIAIAAYLQLRGEWDLIRWRIPSLRDLAWIAGGLLGLLAVLYVVSAIVSFLGVSTAESQITATGRENPAYLLYLIPVTILLVGPTEELIFRGIVQGTFSRAYGPVVGVVGASVVFSSIHLPSLLGSGSGQFATLAIIFALGGLLGVLYEVTDNILVPIVVHGLYNAVQFGLQYATQTGLV